MDPSKAPEKRLQLRELRKGKISAAELEKQAKALPDLADNVYVPSDEELEKLREELTAEHTARNERIQRALEGPPAPEPAPPPIPFEISPQEVPGD